ncbi:tRNA (adenosine(37)-N6)-threonylcarbamoyltransferase complex ATPase subunit type 1 TsaE [[Phormidium ambiguum] IAM M-71]|uniref:tRNA threonylcarbamoyladenosine biosynthesis protein TsaE n=1 Tax=[Phormidium ambiguum] IAM M-71 TaxID=454136 RepID=A0A1U7IS83_9CYAN|nr:tRNA (adenosine(37)-N6)-threonylcarbamoyltransferase complex ATPase subunit type 1 TsaE [Phormidium ambiguum]OKH40371.1 tRNA (adenosine(37)-N6)-threonylcarbamoyltransferase complex ATPase subunit type 1 TsaE [Phormidium ambiguum IAM M-71]
MTFKLQEITLANSQETHQLGIKLGCILPAGTVILLSGDLGAGKTTLVQGIGAGLGITDPIVSPTFTLINEYPEGRLPLYHFDLYRLSPSEVEALSLENYWEGQEFPLGVVAIEWAEKLTYLPNSYLQIQLIYTPDDRRLAKLISRGNFTLSLEDV